MYDLPAIAQYLESVRHKCKADAILLARNPRLVEDIKEIEETASGLLSEFVLRFGVIGDSNAGKSRLIGGLIGKVDALETAGMPLTGNISILHVRSDPNAPATSLGPYELRFISTTAACECMRHLLDTLIAELDGLHGGAGAEFAANGRKLRNGLTENLLVTPDLLAWLEATWKSLAAQAVNLHLRLIELVRFSVTWHYFGKAVAGKRSVSNKPDAAKAATKLPKETRAESFAEFTKLLKQKIVSVTGGSTISELPAEISKEFAQLCYSLVHDARIDVRVPPSIWPLHELRVEAIELFDFPGLAAQGHAARDVFLSQRERRANRIHTWIVVVGSQELRGSQAVDIVKQLPKDRIVAVANRFDALPIWDDGHIDELERLVEPQAPPHREQDVLDRLELLTPLTTGIFEKLTSPDRCVFVSAMLGLSDLDAMDTVLHQVLTDSERKNWPPQTARSRAVQKKWGLLAQKIRVLDPDSRLATWLSAYADPAGQAGLKQLRQILFEHANAVGLEQLKQEMNFHIKEIEDLLHAVQVKANRRVEESQAKADEIRSHLDQLLTVYAEHGEPPASIGDINVRSNGPAINGGLPANTRILSATGKQSVRLPDLIHDETLLRVWDWPQWKALLEISRAADGFVDCSTISTNIGSKRNTVWDKDEASMPPIRAGELHEPFRLAYADIESIAVAGLKSVLADFLSALGGQVASLATKLGVLAQTSPRNIINFALRPHDPDTSGDFFEQVVGLAPGSAPTSVFWRDRFPFLIHADEDGNLTEGPYFGWARERSPERRDKPAHQIYVLRLRNELSNAVEAGVARHTAAGLISFRSRYMEFRETLTRVVDKLKDQSNSTLLALFGKIV